MPDFLNDIQDAIKNNVMLGVADAGDVTEKLIDRKVDLALLKHPFFKKALFTENGWKMNSSLPVVRHYQKL